MNKKELIKELKTVKCSGKTNVSFILHDGDTEQHIDFSGVSLTEIFAGMDNTNPYAQFLRINLNKR